MSAGAEDRLTRPALEILQRQRLRALLDALLPNNRFYARKIAQAGLVAERDAGQAPRHGLEQVRRDRMVEIGRGSYPLANVPAKRAVEFSDVSRPCLKGL